MQDERKRILQLVEDGVISAEEAIVLLEKQERIPKHYLTKRACES